MQSLAALVRERPSGHMADRDRRYLSLHKERIVMAFVLVAALVLPLALQLTGGYAAPPRDGVAKEGTPAYENVQSAIEFLKQMGDTEEAKNVEEWLKKGSISSGDIGSNGETDMSGDITVGSGFIDPGSSQDKDGNHTSIGKSGMNDLTKFDFISELASILVHEKVHAHQSTVYKIASNMRDIDPRYGDNPMELDAWHTELVALDRWIVNMKRAKEYEKAIRLINQKLGLIGELQKSGYGSAGDLRYGDADKKRLEDQKTELQQLLGQGKTMDDQALGQVRRVEDEKQRQVAEAISQWRKEGQAFAEGRGFTVALGQLPSGPAATVGNMVVGRVVSISLVLDRTTSKQDVFTISGRFSRDGEGLNLELSPREASGASLSLRGRETTVRSVVRSPDPAGALLLALRTGDITYSGSLAIPLKMALGVAPTTANFEVKKGETKAIQYQGQPCTLQRNALGSRIVTLPDQKQVVAVDRYGGEVGHSTTGMQRLVAASPQGLSLSAGLLTRPATSAREQGCPSCGSAMLAARQAVSGQATPVRSAIAWMRGLDTTTRLSIGRVR